MHLSALVILLLWNPPVIGSDQLTIALKSFQQRHGVELAESAEPAIPNLLGRTTTYRSGLAPPLDRVWIHATDDGTVFDITLADGGLTDLTRPEAYASVVLLRILFAARTGDPQLFRAVMQASGISVRSRSLLNPDQTVTRLYEVLAAGAMPALTGPDADAPYEAVVEAGRESFTIQIRPTLNLVVNGDVNLFKEKLLRMLGTPTDREPVRLSMYHLVQDDADSRSVELPDFGLYYSRWTFDRVKGRLELGESAFDPLASTELWLPDHAAYWSTLLFPDSLAFRGIQRGADFQIVMSLAMQTGHQSTYPDPIALGPLLTFGDVRLPSYYVVSGVKRTGGQVEVEGYLMVFDPVLHYQHIFRITDTFRGDTPTEVIWRESRIHAVLVMRSEQIQDLNSTYPTGATDMPVFQLRIRP